MSTIPVKDLLTKEEEQLIMQRSTEYAHKALTYISDIFDEFRAQQYGSLVGAQFIGVIAQHMFKMAMANAFANKNEVAVLGNLCLSAIMEGYQINKEEIEKAKQQPETSKELN